MFNFRPSVRPVPLEVHISGYPGKHYCPRMATMNKPTFAAIRTHSPTKPVLVFVSSRRQTRLTALELISFLASEDDPKQWLHMPETEVLLRFPNGSSWYQMNNCIVVNGCLILIFHALCIKKDSEFVCGRCHCQHVTSVAKEKRSRAPCKCTVEEQEILFENGHKNKVQKCGRSIQSRSCGWLCLTFFPEFLF